MRDNTTALKTALYLLLTIATLVVYFPLYKNGFIGFDDHTYIYQNPVLQKGISWEGVRFAFSLDNKTSYWHPLTWLSLMLDYQIWGLNAAGYHLENLLFHLINGLLLFTFLRISTRNLPASAGVALLFMLHPTAVESVAWAVERKTVLSTFFFLLAVISYHRYAKSPSVSRYAAVFLCMVLGLMTKSMIITLPFLLLLLDIWPLGRLNLKSDGGPIDVILVPLIVEKIPLLLLSALSVIISLISHSHSNIVDTTPISGRITHAFISYAEHLGRIFWSPDHSVFYPLHQAQQFSSIVVSSGMLIIITIASCFFIRRYPCFFVGWFWYIIAFAPVSGLLRAGKWPGMADRFLYIPVIGILIIFVFSMSALADKKKNLKPVFVIATLLVSVFFGYQTYRQVQTWHDSITLFSDAVRIDPDNSYAHYLLGRAFNLEKKDYASAEKHLKTAILLDSAEAYYKADLGEVYLNRGDAAKALPYLQEAASVILADTDFLNSLASAQLETGNTSDALKTLDKALQINPAHANTRFNRGIAYYKLGRFSDAKASFEGLLVADPQNLDARLNLGMILIELKEYKRAVEETKLVLNKSPNDENAWINLGTANERSGNAGKALSAYQKALSLKPGLRDALDGITRLEGK